MIVYSKYSRADTNLTLEPLVTIAVSVIFVKEIKCSKGGLGTFEVNLTRFTCRPSYGQYKHLSLLIIQCKWMYCCLP